MICPRCGGPRDQPNPSGNCDPEGHFSKPHTGPFPAVHDFHRIAYIVTIHYHYEGSVQAEEPSKVYTGRAEAEAAAKALDDPWRSGEVWEIELP